MVIYSVRLVIELRSWESGGLRTALHYSAQPHIYQCRLASNANGPVVDIAVLAFLDIFSFPPSVTQRVAFEIQITQYGHRRRCSLSGRAACRNSLFSHLHYWFSKSKHPLHPLSNVKTVRIIKGCVFFVSQNNVFLIYSIVISMLGMKARGHN